MFWYKIDSNGFIESFVLSKDDYTGEGYFSVSEELHEKILKMIEESEGAFPPKQVILINDDCVFLELPENPYEETE